MVGLDETTGRILLCECKWRDLSFADAKRILLDLEKKSAEVRWRNNQREELFCLVGKHIVGKEKLRAEGYRVYDLADVPFTLSDTRLTHK